MLSAYVYIRFTIQVIICINKNINNSVINRIHCVLSFSIPQLKTTHQIHMPLKNPHLCPIVIILKVLSLICASLTMYSSYCVSLSFSTSFLLFRSLCCPSLTPSLYFVLFPLWAILLHSVQTTCLVETT